MTERTGADVLAGEIALHGRVMPASNATFVGEIDGVRCVYKPIRGERPLWDFPDGTLAAVVVYRRSTAADPGDRWLAVVPVAGGPVRALTEAWDRWPDGIRWTPDGRTLIVAADDHGRSPLWRVDVPSGQVTRLTGDDGCYTDFEVAPDGRALLVGLADDRLKAIPR